MAVGSSRPMEDSWRIGQVELIRWFQDLYGLHQMDSYQLLSQITKVPVANVVDANFSVVIKAAKELLPNVSAFKGMHASLKERAKDLKL
jgi:acetamidase/formamidase